jgi:hypothetical protein
MISVYENTKKIVLSPHFIVIIICILIHLYLFWSVMMSAGAIANGDAFLSRDELVPIFDWKNQYIDQILGGGVNLTSSSEVRLSYTFWFAWVRESAILPYAIIGLGALSTYLLTLSSYVIMIFFRKPVSRKEKLSLMLLALVSILPIYLILLFAKITTFYSLIIGFSLFSLALSISIKQMFLDSKTDVKSAFLVAFLVLLNPAVHFHLLFYVLFIPFAIIAALIKRKFRKLYLSRLTLFVFIVLSLSVIPYALLILTSLSSSGADISNQIPLNYWGIFYNSLSLEHILSLNTTAQADVGLYGSYVIPIPRLATIILSLFVVAGFIAILAEKINDSNKLKFMYVFYFILFLVGIFMSLGYTSDLPYTFHYMLKDISGGLQNVPAIGSQLSSLVYTFLNVLRFPHRFQFIEFYAISIMIGLSLMYLSNVPSSTIQKRILTLVMVILLISPFFIDNDYREKFVAGGGDMDGYVKAYEVPQSLKDIKKTLENNDKKNGKLFIFPSLESGRSVNTQDNNYSFIDKALIYYLNTPTYYYGAGADTQNKIIAERVYTSINEGNNTWEKILINNLGITQILLPKQTVVNQKQVQYYRGLDSIIQKRFDQSTSFRKVYDSKDYVLYESTKTINESDPYLIDVQQSSMDKYISKITDQKFIFPVQLKDNSNKYSDKINVISDDIERTVMQVDSALSGDSIFYVDKSTLPYHNDVIESSVFATTGVSLNILNNKNHNYNLFKDFGPSMIFSTSPQFVGTTTSSSSVRVPLVVKGGNTVLAIHAATREDVIEAVVNNKAVKFYSSGTKVNFKDKSPEYKYFKANIKLSEGKNDIFINGKNDEPIFIDGVFVEKANEKSSSYKKLKDDYYEILR